MRKKLKKQTMNRLSIVLDRKISIVKIEETKDDDGFDKDGETEICKLWAKVNNMSGTEVFKSGRDYSIAKTRFVVRYRKDIEFKEDMKIRFNNKLYNIIYVNNYNFSNEFVELITEVVR